MQMQPHTYPIALPYSFRTMDYVHRSRVGCLELTLSFGQAKQECACQPLVQHCTRG